MKTKGIIYYTDNQLKEPIFSIVQAYIAKSELPITSVSLDPIDFGSNIVLNLTPSYVTMIKQIATALENSSSDYVFFCEHDVLYPSSHFDFTPEKDNIWYYNANVLRWKYPDNFLISYDRLISLSGLCVNRELARDHYQRRLKVIEENDLKSERRHEPSWARKWGYEPGTKKTRRGGFSNDEFDTWMSLVPMIDIRHGKTFSPSKVTLDSFKHPPQNWRETRLNEVVGWNLKEVFKLEV